MKRLVNNLESSKESAKNYLSSIDPEKVKFAQNYLDEIDDLVVVEFRRGDFVEVPNDNMKEEIRQTYLQVGAGEGYIDSVKEFNDICKALRLCGGNVQ